MGRVIASDSSAQGLFVEAFEAEAAVLIEGLQIAQAHLLAGYAHNL
jgi:hypothetical protein